MKKLLCSLLLCLSFAANAQVGIGTATPNSSAQLDISATDKGLLIPRMTAAEMAAIASPATGLLVYQTDGTPGFYHYDGSAWVMLHTGVLPISNGGTGSSTQNFVDLTSNQNIDGSKNFSSDIFTATNIRVGKGSSSGDQNTILGNGANSGNTGQNNTAIGFFTLISANTASDNTVVGTNAMRFNTDGNSNTAIGESALQSTQGSGNTGVGYGGLGSNVSGSNNTALGYGANVGYDSLNNATAIGYNAVATENNSIQLGDANVTKVNTAGNLTAGSFIKSGGTSSQFLKADGSVDNNTYLTSSATDTTYLHLTGGTLTGGLTGTTAYFNDDVVMGQNIQKTAPALKLIGYNDDNTTTGGGGLELGDGGAVNMRIYRKSNNFFNISTTASFFPYLGINADSYNPAYTLDINGTLGVRSNANITGTLYVDSTATLNGALSVAKAATFQKDLLVNGLIVGRGVGDNDQNTAFGSNGVLGLGTGMRNTAIGSGAMRSYAGTSFDNNSSVGYFNMQQLTTGQQNTSVGAEAMMSLTTGSANTAIGAQSLIDNTGDNNTALGYHAGTAITSGSGNTFLGNHADATVGNISNSTAIGYGATVPTDNTIQLGNMSVTDVMTAGTYTGSGFVKAGGTSSQFLKADGSVDNNTYLTSGATDTTYLHLTGGTLTGSLTVNSNTTVSGTLDVSNQATFQKDILVNGITAGHGSNNIDENTVFGKNALGAGTGTGNTAVGTAAMQNYSGSSIEDLNSAFGYNSLNQLTSGRGNTAAGAEALYTVTTADENTAFGAGALYSATSASNTAVGMNAGTLVTTAGENTFLGALSDVSSDTITNSTAIGYNARVNGSNTIQLGNPYVTDVKTPGKLTTGLITFPNYDGTTGQVLTTNGSGILGWSNLSATDLSGIIPVANGGTGSSSFTTGNILFGNGNNALAASDDLFWDNANSRLGILTTSPSATFQIGVESGNAADNLKWGVMNDMNTLQLGFRQTGWKLKTGNNSGVVTDLTFASTDGTTDIDKMTIGQSEITMTQPLTAQTSITSPQANFTNLNVNNKIYYNSSDDKVGLLTSAPTSQFQVFGDGNFDNPMKYDNVGSTGILKFGFRGKEFRLTNTTNSGVLVNLGFSYFDGTNDVQSMDIDNNGLVSIGKLKSGNVAFPTADGTSGQVLTTNGSGTATWADPAMPQEMADEFTASPSQTTFNLVQTPSPRSKVKMYINGIRVSNANYSVSGDVVTYNLNTLSGSERIQFDYFY